MCPSVRRKREPLNTAHKAHRPVVMLALAVAFSLAGDVTIYVVVPVHYAALGLTPLQVGILLSANRWIRLASNHLARRVLEQGVPSRVLATALIAGAAASLVYATAPPFFVFLAARALWGVAWSIIRHTGVMTSINTNPESQAAGVYGLYNGVVQLGFIGGTLGGALLFDGLGYSAAFVVAGMVSLLAIPLEMRGFRHLASGSTPTQEHTPANGSASMPMLFRGFVERSVGTGLIISTLGFALRSHFGEQLELGALTLGITTLNGFLIALNYTINCVGSPYLGRLVDRVGRRTGEIAAFGVGALALGGSALMPASPLLLPAVLLFFVATVACKIALVAQAGVSGPRSFAQFVSAADLGAATGPIVGWLAIERVGSPEAVFLLGAALYLIALVSALRSRG